MKTLHYYLVGLLLLSAVASHAEIKDTVRIGNSVVRQEQRNEYYSVYAKMPSLLAQWSYADFAYISGSYSIGDGKFYNPQQFNSIKFLELKTESILTLPETSWRFYGLFNYKNGSSKGGMWNLSYNLSNEGSPYYFMQEKEGDWKYQNYEFKAGTSKSFLNDKLIAGVSLDYIGTLDFRTLDTRNENYKLDIVLTPSLSYRITSNQLLSAGLLYKRIKTEPSIYNKYQHGNDIERHHVFFNLGMGTWDNNPDQINMLDTRWGASLAYSIKKGNQNLDIIYQLENGEELWSLNAISTLSQSTQDYASYKILKNTITASYSNQQASGKWNSILNVSLINGEGSPYKTASKQFVKNYTADIKRANLTASYLPAHSTFKRAGLGVSYEMQDLEDMNYGHTVSYSNLTTKGWVDVLLGKEYRTSLVVGLYGGYNANLSNDHQPKAAAANFYTLKIAQPTLAYLTSSYALGGLKLVAEFNILSTYRFELSLNGEMVKPTAINYAESKATFSTNDSFYNANMSLIFNF